MPNITTCTRCSALYEASSEECANESTRLCFACFEQHNARSILEDAARRWRCACGYATCDYPTCTQRKRENLQAAFEAGGVARVVRVAGRWQCLDCLANGTAADEADEGIGHYRGCPALGGRA